MDRGELLILGADDVAALVEPAALIDALADAFAAAASGAVDAPTRSQLRVSGGGLLVMPGHRPGGHAIVKHVGLYADNVERGLPHHPATICAFDERTGMLRALLDATELTAARTAAAAALSIRLAAREDARVAAVIGAGPVAAAQLAFLPAVRDFAEIRVAARDPDRARRLAAGHGARAAESADQVVRGVDVRAAESADQVVRGADVRAADTAEQAVRGADVRAADTVEQAVRGADVVCLCTSASEPVVPSAALAPGVHVCSVGYAPPGGELDPELARRGRLLVESRDAFAPPPAGCAELAGIDPSAAAELGEVVLGERTGRESHDDLTVYKSMGTVIEDLAAAELVIRRATELGAGRRVVL